MLSRSTEQRAAKGGPHRSGLITSGLLRDYGGQDFMFFALRHIEVVERVGNLRSDFVELFGCYVEILVGFAQLLASVFKGPLATWQSQSVRMNFRPGS